MKILFSILVTLGSVASYGNVYQACACTYESGCADTSSVSFQCFRGRLTYWGVVGITVHNDGTPKNFLIMQGSTYKYDPRDSNARPTSMELAQAECERALADLRVGGMCPRAGK